MSLCHHLPCTNEIAAFQKRKLDVSGASEIAYSQCPGERVKKSNRYQRMTPQGGASGEESSRPKRNQK
ncbi:hypothetical protein TNCV_450401 [Trichonephila clavipes]|nr:hypothetical protein TNCV_450401 [Trichonephila clavipes]